MLLLCDQLSRQFISLVVRQLKSGLELLPHMYHCRSGTDEEFTAFDQLCSDMCGKLKHYTEKAEKADAAIAQKKADLKKKQDAAKLRKFKAPVKNPGADEIDQRIEEFRAGH